MVVEFNSFIYAQNTNELSVLKGDYLGQTLPGVVAVMFAYSYSGYYEKNCIVNKIE